MAVLPITSPIAPGLVAADYSPWTPEAGARSALPGILGYTPGAIAPHSTPYSPPIFRGGTTYGNYVRDNPALMNLFQAQTTSMPDYQANIADYGKQFWDKYGAIGGWTAPDASTVNPNIARGDVMDTAPATAGYGHSGLPMPDVEGYKYVYPKYEWNRDEGYTASGYSEDIDEYPYYPYYPGWDTSDRVRDESGAELDNILVGLRLIKE
jgi:hypothetical protein